LSIFENAENLYNVMLRTGGARQLNNMAATCFSVYIDQSAALTKIDNVFISNILAESGEFDFNYAAGVRFNYGDCFNFGLSVEEQMALRVYILDYNLLSAAACFGASALPDEMFDSNGDGTDDTAYADLGMYACSDFTAGQRL
jgi:hypothetical protein